MQKFATGLLGVLTFALACAGFDTGSLTDLLEGGGLNESTVANGLAEALRVGTERAVADTSSPGGFSDNPLIRIALPEQLDTMAKTLRRVGLGSQVDALDAGMNRAAEKASAEATPVFLDAIKRMTIDDAFSILNGGDTAATAYFQEKTEASLRQRFEPVVGDAMGQVGVYGQYKTLLARYEAIPLVSKPDLDLERYVTDRTLDGLFTVVAQEEQKIREDPAARSTALLQKVFAAQ